MDYVINFKIYLQSSSKAITDSEKKRGIQQNLISREPKSFLDEINSIFHRIFKTLPRDDEKTRHAESS